MKVRPGASPECKGFAPVLAETVEGVSAGRNGQNGRKYDCDCELHSGSVIAPIRVRAILYHHDIIAALSIFIEMGLPL